jgi:inosose dehydratase
VHCKDVRRNVLERSLNRDCSFLEAVLDGVFTVPGDGCVDYPATLAALARADYRGWLVVEAEQDPSVAPSTHYANLGYRNLRRFAGLNG